MALRLTLAGEVGIDAGAGRTDAGGLGRLGRTALAYLVSERHRPVPRGELADVLWGEDLPRSWETSLRVTASRIRTWFTAAGLEGSVALTSAFGCYHLRLPETMEVDVERAAADLEGARSALAGQDFGAARARALSAAAIAAREFLPGGSGSWVERRQDELRELRVVALETLADAALAEGDAAGALGAAEEAVTLEPLREPAYLRVMAAYAALGNRGAALRTYERCRHLLAEELGLSPSAATEAAYLSLLGDEMGEEPAAPPAAAPTAAGPTAAGPLPVPVSSFVGREAEVAEVAALVRSARLVTLLGAGGVGKTRLALEVGAARGGELRDGAVLVGLADVADPDHVPAHALAALGVPEQPGASPTHTLAAAVHDRPLLLVVDNCEHVIEAASGLVNHLLRSCPDLTVLATSREPLGVSGEVVWRVPSLAPADAARLFVERARAADPHLALSPADDAAVAEICARLDGIPLALELAAARCAVLSVAEVAGRLDDRFPLLAGGPRTAPSRHQTLRAAVDWTYESLSGEEQAVLQQLSVFAGSFTLAAAGRVAVDDGDALDWLSALVNRSLVLTERRGRETRYRLLETIRAYAAEKLDGAGMTAATGHRLLAWAVELAETAEVHLDGPHQATWLDLLEVEHPNLRAALRVKGDPVGTLRLATALGRFWEVHGHLEEGRRALRRALDGGDGGPDVLQARAQNLAGALAQRQGDYAAARSRYETALAIRRRLGDPLGVAIALHGLGNLAALDHDAAGADALYQESLALGRSLGEPGLVAAALANLGWVAHTTGDFPSARAYYEEALTVRRAVGDHHGIAVVLGHLGDLAYQQADYAAAAALHRESLALRTELGDRAGRADSLATLGHLALQAGDHDAARAHLEESLDLRRQLGDRAALPGALANLADLAMVAGRLDDARHHLEEAEAAATVGRDQQALVHVLLHQGRVDRTQGRLDDAARRYTRARQAAGHLGPDPLTAEWLEGVGATLAARGDPVAGARLLGAADALREAVGAPVPPQEGPAHDRDEAGIRAALGDEAFTAAWTAGHALPPDEAVIEAEKFLG